MPSWTTSTLGLLTTLLMVGVVTAIQVDISQDASNGLTFKIPNEGYSLVGVHYSVNKPLPGVTSGDKNVDIITPTGNHFEYQDPSVHLKAGDVVNYWVLAIQQGQGKQILDQSFIYTGPTTTTKSTTTTTTTTTPTTTTMSPRKSTVPMTEPLAEEGPVEEKEAPPRSQTGSEESETGASSSPAQSSSSSSSSSGCGCSGKAVVEDPYNKESTCTTYPCLIFEDEFDQLDTRLWEHEITAGGGGNWEFQYYTNNRSNSYVRDGVLYLKPVPLDQYVYLCMSWIVAIGKYDCHIFIKETLATDRYGPRFPEEGNLNLWGMSPDQTCTGNDFFGCQRSGMPNQVVNPIQSARVRSSRSFNFKYGRVEVEAKMPNGDWLWPAIWLLPRWHSYGFWPASGEIDIVESRGNQHLRDAKGQPAGVDSMGSTLHFGPFVDANQWPKAHAEYQAPSGTFGDSFHKYAVDWTDTYIKFSVDGKEILKVDPGPGGFWDFGDFAKEGQGHWENPWAAGSRMAPFDQEFYIIMNVAVGGVGFFPDTLVNTPYPKPWHDKTGHAATDFWHARSNWLPTWKLDQNNGEDAALRVKNVRVWKTKPSH